MADFARSADPAVQAQLDRLGSPTYAADILGLDRIVALLDALGRPQDRLPPVLHVAGTNGKGSTCALLRAALEAAGHRVHVFTSPHLVRFNERIRLVGGLIEDRDLAPLLAETLDTGIAASFFEVTTAAALLAFSRVAADAVILEVGLGGRLDATNVIDRPLVTGIASVGIDHQSYLGATLAGIATEKAGIAKRGVPLVSLAQPAEATTAIERVAAERGAPLLLEGRDWAIDPALQPPLPGAHQIRNANLAWAMLSAQTRLAVSHEQFVLGIAGASWPARFQRLADGPLSAGRTTYVDGAHNGDAARALAAVLAERGAMHLVIGLLANKDAAEVIGLLAPHALSLTFVAVPDHASHDPEEVAAHFGGRAATSLEEALAGLPAPRLIAGSLYLAGVALAANREEPR